MTDSIPKKVNVWDIPVWLFHWALVVLIVLQVVTAEADGRGFGLHFFSVTAYCF